MESIRACLPFSLTFVGAFALYILARNKGSTPWSVLYALNISVSRRAKPGTILLDGVLTSLLGAIIAYIVTDPVTNAHAIAAGLSSTGIINSLAKNDGN